MNKKINQRIVEHDVNKIFPTRWSPRAMSGEKIKDEELNMLFEAARWAPSSYNNQPWRFVYAKKDTENWEQFFNLLAEPNKVWAKNAAILILVISKNNFDFNNKLSRTHSFDTGAAWQNLALQGSINGLVVHAMEGFDYEKARQIANISSEFIVEAIVAVGKQGKKEDLPQNLQEKENPSDRKKIKEFIFEGKMN